MNTRIEWRKARPHAEPSRRWIPEIKLQRLEMELEEEEEEEQQQQRHMLVG